MKIKALLRETQQLPEYLLPNLYLVWRALLELFSKMAFLLSPSKSRFGAQALGKDGEQEAEWRSKVSPSSWS